LEAVALLLQLGELPAKVVVDLLSQRLNLLLQLFLALLRLVEPFLKLPRLLPELVLKDGLGLGESVARLAEILAVLAHLLIVLLFCCRQLALKVLQLLLMSLARLRQLIRGPTMLHLRSL